MMKRIDVLLRILFIVIFIYGINIGIDPRVISYGLCGLLALECLNCVALSHLAQSRKEALDIAMIYIDKLTGRGGE